MGYIVLTLKHRADTLPHWNGHKSLLMTLLRLLSRCGLDVRMNIVLLLLMLSGEVYLTKAIGIHSYGMCSYHAYDCHDCVIEVKGNRIEQDSMANQSTSG